MALQQAQLPQQSIGELLRIISEVKRAFLQDRRQESCQLLAAAIEPGHSQGGGDTGGRTTEAKAVALSKRGKRLGQTVG